MTGGPNIHESRPVVLQRRAQCTVEVRCLLDPRAEQASGRLTHGVRKRLTSVVSTGQAGSCSVMMWLALGR